MKVSVLLLTFNEEVNLPACLDALGWCDDVVIVDSFSTDKTVEIAKSRGVKVLQRPFDNFAGQRNWGLQYADFKNEWVFHLDADEIITPEFLTELSRLNPRQDISAYQVPSKMMLFGRWIKHAGMYPTYQVRLGHRDKLRFKQVGHGQREDLAPERVGVFDTPYLHYSFSQGLFAWLQKHIRYARDEAALILETQSGIRQNQTGTGATDRRRRAKVLAAHIPGPLRPFLRFAYVYFWKQGFRDGHAGFAYAFMLAVYEGMTAILLMEAIINRKRTLGISALMKEQE